jgi:hypothetical protein
MDWWDGTGMRMNEWRLGGALSVAFHVGDVEF